MAQGTAWVLRWRTSIDKVPARLHQEIRSSSLIITLFLAFMFRSSCCHNGEFSHLCIYGRKYIHVLERKHWRQGGHSLKGESQEEESSLYPKDCGTNRVDTEKFLGHLCIQDVTHISSALFWSLYRGNNNDEKRMRYQNLPFWEYTKRTGPYKNEEQKNAITIQLNAYYKILCKACISENIKWFYV